MQKPTEPEAEHNTGNSPMTAHVKTLKNIKTIVNHEDMLEVQHCDAQPSSQSFVSVLSNFFL